MFQFTEGVPVSFHLQSPSALDTQRTESSLRVPTDGRTDGVPVKAVLGLSVSVVLKHLGVKTQGTFRKTK